MSTFYTWPLYIPPAVGSVEQNAQVQADTLGTDLFFGGSLEVGAHGDYEEVSGEENYRRAIFRRLITSPGEYRLNPSYGAGVGDYVYAKLTTSTIDELTARIREQVAADRRTDQVLSVTVTPMTFGDKPGIQVVVVAMAFGRTLRPLAYNFTKQA